MVLMLMRKENNLLGQIYNINPSRKVFVGVPEMVSLLKAADRGKQNIFFRTKYMQSLIR